MSTNKPAPVAIVFAINLTATSSVNCSAIKPEPTIIITKKQLPMNSDKKYFCLFFKIYPIINVLIDIIECFCDYFKFFFGSFVNKF